MRPVALPLVLVLLAALGCRSVPPTHYYDLRPSDTQLTTDGGPTSTEPIGVGTFAVDPPYDQDQLVYRVGSISSEIGFYRTHRWSAPIGRLVALQFAHRLTAPPSIGHCEPAQAGVDYSTTLEGRLFHIEEVDLADGQLVRLQLEVRLVHRGRTIWRKLLTSETKVRVETTGEIVDQIRRDLYRLIDETKLEIGEILHLTSDGGPAR